MFKCLECNSSTQLPICKSCGYEFNTENGIFNLTNDPNMNLDDNGDNYIGYDDIGRYYSGRLWYEITTEAEVRGRAVADIVGSDLLLDLACGDGQITVPAAKYGCSIIAGDISANMLCLLIKKAEYNNIDLSNVILCKMNALDIPLKDNSIDYVLANSMLHLVSNPKKVLTEIKRVLKKGGSFISLEDTPGNYTSNNADTNDKYFEIANEFYNRYWEVLKSKRIVPRKYNWNIDKLKICNEIFSKETVITIDDSYVLIDSLKNNMLYRVSGRGFSDQADVPDEIHEQVYKQVMNEFINKYGEDFAEITSTIKITSSVIKLYKK